MNKEDIHEVREYLMTKLNTLRNGSYPSEVKILEKLLVITTGYFDTSSSSSTNNHSQQKFKDDIKLSEPPKGKSDSADTLPSEECSQSKSKTNSEEQE